MSHGPTPDNDPPQCDAACQKIILNGFLTAQVIAKTYEMYERHIEKNGPLSKAATADLIKRLNDLENRAFEFARAYMEAVGYAGPWPKSLS